MHSHSSDRTRLTWALGLAAGYMILEIVGGLVTGSVALLADAGHMATDVGALAVALWAAGLTRKPSTPERTFGYLRAEILAALANGAVLAGLSLVILFEALRRLSEPRHIEAGTMMFIAVGGLVVNGVGAALLHGGRHHNLNVKGAWLHVIGDALGSIGVILGGAAILLFGWQWADPVAGALIAVLVLISAWRLVRDSVNVLMLRVPRELDPVAVRERLESIDGVTALHDLHIWTVASGLPVLTAHAQVRSAADVSTVLDELNRTCLSEFGIEHVTIQPETEAFQPGRPCA